MTRLGQHFYSTWECCRSGGSCFVSSHITAFVTSGTIWYERQYCAHSHATLGMCVPSGYCSCSQIVPNNSILHWTTQSTTRQRTVHCCNWLWWAMSPGATTFNPQGPNVVVLSGRSWDQISALTTGYTDWGFLWFSFVLPGKCWDSILKLGRDCFLPDPFLCHPIIDAI
jgi:hypothetical protein